LNGLDIFFPHLIPDENIITLLIQKWNHSLLTNPTFKDKSDPSYKNRLQALGQAAGLWDTNASHEKMNTENNANRLDSDRIRQQDAALDRGLKQDELGMKREAQGFQTRVAARLEALQASREFGDRELRDESGAAAVQALDRVIREYR
jgi:hypothetical protein